MGMGYAGVITSEMFDLNAAVDTTTQKLLETQRVLSAKTQLSDVEKEELGRATSQLDAFGFRYQMRDPVYTEYLRARAEQSEVSKIESSSNSIKLDPDEARRLVREALNEIGDEGKS